MNVSILYLVGFMGAGKTSVGRRLAELVGWRFVDLDQKIEEREGVPIRDLFRREGEVYFREIEREELQSVSTQTHTVVALGGGTFCQAENQVLVRTTGASVWLDAPIDLLFSRCDSDPSRPLFTTREEMEHLLERRRPFYEKANLRMEVAGLSVNQVAQKILDALQFFGQ